MYWIFAGDIHEETAGFARIPGIRQAQGIVLTGDLTNRGNALQAEAVLNQAMAFNPAVLAQVGNMDQPAVTERLTALGANIHCQARLLSPGLVLMGVGYSTPTPFDTPSEASEELMARWLAETHAKARALAGPDTSRCRLVAAIHSPPYGTTLDRLPGGVHVGSHAVRAFLESAQPEVCVCGHIHEGFGEERLGATHVLNPGMLAQGGYVRLDYADGAVTAALMRL